MSDSSEPSAPPVPRPKPSRVRRLFQNLALAACTFLLCGVALEVALRIAGFGNLEIYEADPVLYWKLKPNQDCYTKIDRKPVHINSRGTRGPEFLLPKPAGTYRILSLGDSVTFGWGLSEEETYSGRIERLLQDRLGTGRRIEVINAGCNAWSYPQMHMFFRDVGLKFQPDMVLLGEANLWTQFSEQNSPEFVRSFMMRVRVKNFLRRFAIYHYVVEYKLRDLYEQQRNRFVPVDPKTDTLFKEQQQKDPDAFFREHIRGLCELALKHHVQPVLLFLPRLRDLHTNEVGNVLRAKTQVSRECGAPLVDTSGDIRPRGLELYLEGDPVHFNATGNEILARRISEFVHTLLAP